MTIIELRNKRAQKLAAAKAYLEAKRTPDGFLSEEDDATYTKLETEITNLGNEIARMERLEALDNELSKPVNTPITEKPAAPAKMDTKTGRASDAYKKAFWNVTRHKDSMTPEMKSVYFALLFEFDGDIKAIRHVLYNCTASRPSIESETKEETIEPGTETLSLTADPREDGLVKSRTGDDTSDSVYRNWYQTVYVPQESGSTPLAE